MEQNNSNTNFPSTNTNVLSGSTDNTASESITPLLIEKDKSASLLPPLVPETTDEKVWLRTLAEKMGLPYIDVTQYVLNETLSRQLPESYARRFHAILLAEDENQYLLGMTNPLDIFATDELQHLLKRPLKFALIDEKDLLYKLDQLYRRTSEITSFADKLALELRPDGATNEEEEKAIKQAEPAVTQLLNSVFADAIQIGASDIHIEPAENILRIRARVDGLLQEQIISITDKLHIPLAVAQRLKLMSGLNIAEKRLPQDGRFEIVHQNMKIDIRLSTMPTQYGESIVMRLLNKSNKILSLDNAGMPPGILKDFRQLIKIPWGIILVTGPTGSGKTTTLYGALSEINDVTKNIVTIEDPIEYTLERANQIQVKPQIGLTFARVLRSVLRQDPNIILVGEIRDQETASIAMRAALTGHLVFATLHTNDAISAAIRLIDIGVENYLVAATVRGVLAQRLARRICSRCSTPHKPTEQETTFFVNFFGDQFAQSTFNHGAGCAYCGFTGSKGMIGVFELLEIDSKMQEDLRRKNTNDFIQTATIKHNKSTLLTSAFEMAQQKIITLGEVMRIAGEQI